MPLQNTPNLVQLQIDIVTIVSKYVPLQSGHRALRGVCPFHADVGTSLMVSADKNIFRCFGCGKDGGPIEFVMAIEQKSYQDAITRLSNQLNTL